VDEEDEVDEEEDEGWCAHAAGDILHLPACSRPGGAPPADTAVYSCSVQGGIGARQHRILAAAGSVTVACAPRRTPIRNNMTCAPSRIKSLLEPRFTGDEEDEHLAIPTEARVSCADNTAQLFEVSGPWLLAAG
jgi:hypothetical protein